MYIGVGLFFLQPFAEEDIILSRHGVGFGQQVHDMTCTCPETPTWEIGQLLLETRGQHLLYSRLLFIYLFIYWKASVNASCHLSLGHEIKLAFVRRAGPRAGWKIMGCSVHTGVMASQRLTRQPRDTKNLQTHKPTHRGSGPAGTSKCFFPVPQPSPRDRVEASHLVPSYSLKR